MILRSIREPSRDLTTLGSLYVDDVWQCWQLEDELREVPGQPAARWKVYGETAIAAGVYRVALTKSARFGVVMPELLDVDGFTGIRCHWGNKRQDSLGCIIVGRHRVDAERRIVESRLAWEALMAKLHTAPAGSIEWHIENPRGYRAVSA